MQVDRSRFLLLTASIASGACAPRTSDGNLEVAEPTVVVEPTGDEPLVVEREPAVDKHAAGDKGAVSAHCQALKPPPGPHCESFEDTVNDCRRYGEVLVPDVAEKASACLSEQSGKPSICDFGISGRCYVSASRGVSPEREAQDRCRALVSSCAQKSWRNQDLTLASCSAGYAAVVPGRRDALATCITESCELTSCFWSLEPP